MPGRIPDSVPMPLSMSLFMSKTLRTPRAKSSGVRSLGSLRLQHGVSSPGISSRNDPALHINQIAASAPLPSASNHIRDFAKEKEFQALKAMFKSQWKEQVLLKNKQFLAFKEKEKRLKDQVSGLEKIIAQLRAELKRKTEDCQSLQNALADKVQQHDEAISCYEKKHEKTKAALQLSENTVNELNCSLESTKRTFESKINELTDDYEKRLKDLENLKNNELQDKDKKMDILKKRMAESLGKNSMERQQQLEELKRDLVKQAQEASDLQQKLKHFQFKSRQCSNCEKLQSQLEEKVLQVRLKEKTINDLQGIGRKMQLQLHQQGAVIDGMDHSN